MFIACKRYRNSTIIILSLSELNNFRTDDDSESDTDLPDDDSESDTDLPDICKYIYAGMPFT